MRQSLVLPLFEARFQLNHIFLHFLNISVYTLTRDHELLEAKLSQMVYSTEADSAVLPLALNIIKQRRHPLICICFSYILAQKQNAGSVNFVLYTDGSSCNRVASILKTDTGTNLAIKQLQNCFVLRGEFMFREIICVFRPNIKQY